MFIYIPGELIALITFPGIILHEIAHRFFCDFFHVPVYSIRYFIPFSTTAGCVVHEPTNNIFKFFFIGCGPLIINSLVCMVLTFPFGLICALETNFIVSKSIIVHLGYIFITWIGLCAGLKAFPSNQDIAGLAILTESFWAKVCIYPFIALIHIVNLNYISFWIRFIYAYLLSLILPRLFLYFA